MSPNVRHQFLSNALKCLETERWRRAEAECQALLLQAPDDVEGTLLLGLTVAAMGEADRAAPLLNKVAAIKPDHAHPCRDLAEMRPAVPRRLVASQYRACLVLSPADSRLRRDFASFLLDHDGPAEALAVLEMADDCAATRNLRGIALAELGRFQDAITAFEHAVGYDPVPSIGWSNLGLMLKIEGRYDDAIAAYDEAVARSPKDAHIHVNRAVALLHAGRWTEAWGEYEWRLRLPGHTPLPLDRLLPAIDTLGDLREVTILAQHEEGFGDTLHFMRYLPLLSERGARVIAMVPQPLARLVASVAGVEEIVSSVDPLPAYDFHCPFFSLPRAFGSTVATVPNEPYVAADPVLSARWKERLPATGLRVGLVWAGQARPWLPGFSSLDARRSAGLAAFAPLAAVPGLSFVSLQAAGPAAQCAQIPPAGMSLFDPMGSVEDFADTAAIIDNLDVVVSVDTAVVHLAGAMGKPVFLVDRYDNCWRWLSGRADSPWYPSMTIFRQSRLGDWSEPMERMAAALAGMAAFHGAAAKASSAGPDPKVRASVGETVPAE
jgi:tetratricopeptide (TPR) repeat protein